jgi:hypothetical protein
LSGSGVCGLRVFKTLNHKGHEGARRKTRQQHEIRRSNF